MRYASERHQLAAAGSNPRSKFISRGGDRILCTQTQTSEQAILFHSYSISSCLPFFIHSYTPDDIHATVTESDARSHHATALY